MQSVDFCVPERCDLVPLNMDFEDMVVHMAVFDCREWGVVACQE